MKRLRGGRTETEEFEIHRDHFEEHVGADLD